MARAKTEVGDRGLSFEPVRIVCERVRQRAARDARVVQREDLKLRVPLEHRADRLERSFRIAANRKHRAAVLEMKVVGDQQIHRAGPVADHGAVERVVADVGLLRPGDGRLRLPDDQSRADAVRRHPALPQPVERGLVESHHRWPAVRRESDTIASHASNAKMLSGNRPASRNSTGRTAVATTKTFHRPCASAGGGGTTRSTGARRPIGPGPWRKPPRWRTGSLGR